MRPMKICPAIVCSFLLAVAAPDQATAQSVNEMLRLFETLAQPPAQRRAMSPRRPGPRQAAPRVEQRQDVRQAQEMLNALGYDAGPADGLMGPRTRAAIEAFQRDYGRQATGTLDDRTLRVLAGAALGHGLETNIAVPGLADEVLAPGLSGLYQPRSPGLLPLAVHGVPYNDEEVLDVEIGNTAIRAARALPSDPGEPFVFAR